MKPKRLILSRKGFDSASGGCPSPIFPDGTMYSLPIPSRGSGIAYGDLEHGDTNIGKLVSDLTQRRHPEKRLGPGDEAHLDPDLDAGAYPREPGWRALLGQAEIAQRHLEKEGVAAGDLFLFFGLYRQVEASRAGWRFVKGSRRLHLLWGWLQIGEVCKVDRIESDERFRWARYHDHFLGGYDETNTVHVASENLDLGDGLSAPGFGVFRRFDSRLILTEPGKGVSEWRLPQWFYPDGNKTPLSYHGDLGRWRYDCDYAYLQSVGRGQEFVLDLEQYPEAVDWVSGLVSSLTP